MKRINTVISTAVLAGLMGSGTVMAEATVSGLVEVGFSSVETDAGDTTYDIGVATVELGVEAEISSDVSAHLLFLYEDDGATPFGVDEATISVILNETTTLIAGQTYVPFGKFDTNVISDPMTLEMGETGDSVFMIENTSGNATSSFYVFKGDSQDAAAALSADDTDLGYGFNVAFVEEEIAEFGLGYISNIADSDMLQELDGSGGATAGDVDTYVAGMAINVAYTSGPTTLILEHMTAMDDFIVGDFNNLAAITAPIQPSATHVEIAYDMGEGKTFALAYGMSDEAEEIGLMETTTAVALAMELREGASLAFEYLTAEDYAGASEDTITIQLAAEF